MLKLVCLTALLLCGCSNVLPTTTTPLKSPNREADSLSEQYYEHSLNSKTLNVRCSMPVFCCVQYENVMIDGKEHKSIVGLCIGI
jgi:hypothetical protein